MRPPNRGRRRGQLGLAVGALRRRRRPLYLGSLGSTLPVDDNFGYGRGTPVDRWYIERFLGEHAADIAGRVLEVKDPGYTRRFGRAVTQSAVVDIDPDNPCATHVADLADGGGLPDDAFDCFILTQTLQYVFDVPAALRTAHRVLRPGGVLLVTVPAVSRIRPASEDFEDYWRFTPLALRRLLEGAFGEGAISLGADGSVLSQVAFLAGLAADDLTAGELAAADPAHPLLVCARAVKAP